MTAPTPECNSVSLTDNLVPCRGRLPPGLKDWVDDVASFAAYSNALFLNGHQIGRYVREQARKALRYPWHSWRVDSGNNIGAGHIPFSGLFG
jgi:hypothetical protein